MTWEERWHPLRREWVIVSSHRDNRPWRGEHVAAETADTRAYVADCYLCPGNVRVSGERNAEYRGVYVFGNDHPCVGPDAPESLEQPPGIYQNRSARGLARVVCFTPRHDVSLSRLPQTAFEDVLGALAAQYRELGAMPGIRHVLTFENRGEITGTSNPHPHGQIYATNFVFRTIEVEAQAQAEHLAANGRPLFGDIIAAEEQDGRRVLVSNAAALAFVPYFARYPYETYIAPRATRPSLAALGDAEIAGLAAALRETLIRYDNLWRMPFPYVMTFHQAPTGGVAAPGFHFHIQILPPLRRPGLLKYLAGPEAGGGNFLNDTAPEAKAAELKAVSAVHYTEQ